MTISEKAKTNKKWTSSKKYKSNYDKIFGANKREHQIDKDLRSYIDWVTSLELDGDCFSCGWPIPFYFDEDVVICELCGCVLFSSEKYKELPVSVLDLCTYNTHIVLKK